ncbi:MAG: hypothetical protein WAL56_20890 [Candidatus Sulfotelmatobacter sp.]
MPNKITYGPPLSLQDLLDLLEHAGNRGLRSGSLNMIAGEPSQDGSLGDARALFISGIAVKQVAAHLPDGDALATAVDQTIADWEDDYCGTPPRPIPTLGLAVTLAAFAGKLQAGELQAAIQEEASRLAKKLFPHFRPHNQHRLKQLSFIGAAPDAK